MLVVIFLIDAGVLYKCLAGFLFRCKFGIKMFSYFDYYGPPPPLALPYLHEENATPKSSFLRVLTMPSAFNSALTGSVNLSSNGFTSSFEVGKCPVNRTLLTS